MRIRNDLVSIKIGSKQYDFKNLILSDYLRRFAWSQLDEKQVREKKMLKSLKYCLLKFDTPVAGVNPDPGFLRNQDFDICLVEGASNIVQDVSSKEISIKYTYKSDWNIYDYKKGIATDNYISNYYGKKITAIRI